MHPCRRRTHACSVAFALVASTLAAPGLAQEGAPPAPAATEQAADDDVLPFLDRCISDNDREKAAAGGKQEAFGPRPIPLGPLFWATADRTLIQAALLYWRVLDVEENTKLSLMLPLYFDHCSPAARTSIGPVGLFGARTDKDGIAGWVGPYFYRRDQQALTDVLFPLFWWTRDQQDSTFVLGPGFHLKRGGQHLYGLAPVFFGRSNDDDGSYLNVAPAYLSWGDKLESTTLALQTIVHEDPESALTASVPFYFSWRDKLEGTWGRVIPPLMSVAWGDDKQLTDGHVMGPYYRSRDGERLYRGIVPLWFSYRGPLGERWDWAPLGLTALWGDDYETNILAAQTYYRGTDNGWRLFSIPFFGAGADKDGSAFAIAPPLAFAHFSDGLESRTFALQTYLHRWGLNDEGKPTGFDLWSFPFYFGGKTPEGRYYDVVPLAFARWGDDVSGEENILLGPNWYQREQSRWSLLSLPFYYGRGDDERGSYLHAFPLALSAFWSDGKEGQAIVAGYYDLLSTTGHHTGLIPFFHTGETTDGASSPMAWLFRESLLDPILGKDAAEDIIPREDLHYRIVPPLAYAHFGTERGKERTLFAQTLIMRDQTSWDVWSMPFYFGGADHDGSYHIIPPLLFASAHAPHGGFTFAPGFWQDRRPDRTITLALQTRAEFSKDKWVLWSVPLYFGGGDNKGHYHLLPPLLSGERYDKTTGDYFRVIAPALHASWKDEHGLTAITGPWIDSRDNAGGRTKALVPLYAGTENNAGYFDMFTPFYFQWGQWKPGHQKPGTREALNKRALLLPALAYYSDQPDGTMLLAPGLWHRSDKTSSETVFFPGYFDVERPDFSATVIAGAWWDFSWTSDDGGPRSLLLAPAYARWEDPEEVLHVAGPVAWSSGKGKNSQAWSFHAEPFVSFWSFRPEHLRWQVGLGAFGYERDKNREQMTIFWVDTQPTERGG
jgi:hypothetical protein